MKRSERSKQILDGSSPVGNALDDGWSIDLAGLPARDEFGYTKGKPLPKSCIRMTKHAVRILPERRHYNQFVSNQVLEDYALRFTATRSRRWSCGQVANTAIGAGSFLALEAIGAAITLHYGFANAAMAIGVVCSLIFVVSLPIAYHAARAGVDIDLLTRGAGFGYLGSTITSLIYASFTFLFFAIEAAIMATVLELWLGMPLSLGYVVSSFIIIPVVLYGITSIGRFQRLSQPVWIGMQLTPFVLLAWQGGTHLDSWSSFTGNPGDADSASGLDLLRFGAASAVLFALIAQIGEQVDYLRFLPRQTKENRTQWWAALICAGPGWIAIGALKLFAGSFLVVFALNTGVSPGDASEPVHMYHAAWGAVMPADWALAMTAVFVIVCQTKINVTNAYAGSIAWSNFFSRVTHSHPGRVIWVIFNVAIALMLMELGVYRSLEHTLSAFSIVAVAWIGALAADLAIVKPLGLSPSRIEFRRAHLYDVNPTGIGAMFAGATLGLLAHGGLLGQTAQALAGYLSLATAILLVPALAFATQGRLYLAHRVGTSPNDRSAAEVQTPDASCRICEHRFEPEDMTHCPAYGGAICSLCCTLDNRCEDRCRPNAHVRAQSAALVDHLLPVSLRPLTRSPIVRYVAMLFGVALALLLIISLVYMTSSGAAEAERALVYRALRDVFFVLLIVAGVLTWIFLLVSDSRRASQLESVQQNELLASEIEAHERTERALEIAKEAAEAANQAKSRYLYGLSHELRSPLNSILGYAQLIDGDPEIPANRQGAVRVINQSAEHLAGLIESLLDISQIEAGRFSITRERVELRKLLEQIADMFRLQAGAKELDFEFHVSRSVPDLVTADGKRLRQVLINLLSNAIRYTKAGKIRFSISYRNQVAEFQVIDTGIGIAAVDIQRIFEPFETVSASRSTGLGLTITKLLTEIMGGDISVQSTSGVGSVFCVRLLVSSIEEPVTDRPIKKRVTGYTGSRRHIGVVDDDPSHRSLMLDLLSPLGFHVHVWADAESCLAVIDDVPVDIWLLDISLPGIDGRALEQDLYARFGTGTPVIIVSANVNDYSSVHIHDSIRHDHFVKPLDLDLLLDRIRSRLGFAWIEAMPVTLPCTDYRAALPDADTLATLEALSSIGHVAGLRETLRRLEEDQPSAGEFVDSLSELLDRYELAGVHARLMAARTRQEAGAGASPGGPVDLLRTPLDPPA